MEARRTGLIRRSKPDRRYHDRRQQAQESTVRRAKKVLVTGSREWDDIQRVVESLQALPPGTVIIHGACRGADLICAAVAEALGFTVRAYPANWDALGRRAGIARNQDMLNAEHVDGDPIDLCIAFHDNIASSRGTADMLRRARLAGILVEHVESGPRRGAGDVIDSFSGDFGFLSNFYESSIWVDGERYATVEHAYQAAKANDPTTKKMIRDARTPYVAKRLGKSVVLPADWDTKRIEVMRALLAKKFENPLLRSLLLATEDAELVEGNAWGDRFWGVCRGDGQNWLGRLLMEVRKECKASLD